MKGCYVYMTIIIISEIITLSSDKHTLRIMKIIIHKEEKLHNDNVTP